MFLKPHVWTQFALSYQNSLIKGLHSFLARMFEFSQAHVKVSMAVNSSLNQMEPPTSSSKEKACHLCHWTVQPDSFPPLLCSISPAQLPVQWWMRKWKECNTAHDWLHGKGRNLQKTPSWELILYHSLLLLSHECLCDSFQHFEISWYL